MIKNLSKRIIVAILYFQVKRLFTKKPIKIIGVTGSFGKTSTKIAIAKVLSSKYKVCYQEGNYNDIVTVPFVLFGRNLPSLYNPFSWIITFIKNELSLLGSYDYEIAVLELGTDSPGQIPAFGKYLKLDFAVITSLALEHMTSFIDLSDVAHEELSVVSYSGEIIYNYDLCPSDFINKIDKPKVSYGFKSESDYLIKQLELKDFTQKYEINKKNKGFVNGNFNSIAKPSLYSVAAAAVIADNLNIEKNQIESEVELIKPLSGRMQILEGVNNSSIIDDSYNSSPQAAKAALDVLYSLKASQKVAVLGSMNELGKYSELSHTEVGKYCNPKKLDLVLTIGNEANQYLAPAAKKNGCLVESFDNPYDAADYLLNNIKQNAIILVKGSQNGVFTEETIKKLLKNIDESNKLVRQSKYWLKQKSKAFK